MPFAFQLPTTGSTSLTPCFSSSTHPSLPQTATIKRNTLRSVLKKHKRLTSQERSSNLTSIQNVIEEYLPYLFAIDAGLSSRPLDGEEIEISLRKELGVQWRSTLSQALPSRDPRRVKGRGLDSELDFVLSTLAYAHVNTARSSLLLLYGTITPSVDQRVKIIQNATKSLLSAASLHTYLATRSLEADASQSAVETLSQTHTGLSALALAEATLLVVLKDDPHPFVVAQMRKKNDKEWMIKAPEIPKVRAHLLARLCLATADHAATAEAGLSASGKVSQDLVQYVSALRKTARAKALRLQGIAAEGEGETGTAIAWLRGARKVLGYAVSEEGGGSTVSGLRQMKKNWLERREDKKVESGGEWGNDAGRLEELRVVEYLDERWTKMNDTVSTAFICLPPTRSDSFIDQHASGTSFRPLDCQYAFWKRGPYCSAVCEADARRADPPGDASPTRAC